jgi:hypothetical protein
MAVELAPRVTRASKHKRTSRRTHRTWSRPRCLPQDLPVRRAAPDRGFRARSACPTDVPQVRLRRALERARAPAASAHPRARRGDAGLVSGFGARSGYPLVHGHSRVTCILSAFRPRAGLVATARGRSVALGGQEPLRRRNGHARGAVDGWVRPWRGGPGGKWCTSSTPRRRRRATRPSSPGSPTGDRGKSGGRDRRAKGSTGGPIRGRGAAAGGWRGPIRPLCR